MARLYEQQRLLVVLNEFSSSEAVLIKKPDENNVTVQLLSFFILERMRVFKSANVEVERLLLKIPTAQREDC